MKILIPIDFSSCSKNALNAAVLIAKKHNAELHLFHVRDDFFPWTEVSLDDEQNTINLIIENKLDELQDSFKSEELASTKIIRSGSFIKQLEKQAENVEYQLIVMGSHGISGKKEWFIGSNTQKVIRRVNTKVLVIKNKLESIDFKKVLFVTGLEKDNKGPFLQFLDFIKPYNVQEIHTLTVNTLGYNLEPTASLSNKADTLKSLAPDYHMESHLYSDYSIDAGVRHFSEENDIDLIAISNHSRHPIKRIFQGSNVEIIINHSNLPTLSIDY